MQLFAVSIQLRCLHIQRRQPMSTRITFNVQCNGSRHFNITTCTTILILTRFNRKEYNLHLRQSHLSLHYCDDSSQNATYFLILQSNINYKYFNFYYLIVIFHIIYFFINSKIQGESNTTELLSKLRVHCFRRYCELSLHTNMNM